MNDTNTPSGTGDAVATPTAQLVDELADILDDPEPDTEEKPAAKPASKAKPKSEPRDAVLDDGDTGLDDDATDENTDEEPDKGPDEYAGGKFAADSARVKLPDGSTITVGELRKSPLRQSDYTRKTQELSEQRKSFEADQQRASQVDQQLQAQFARVNWWLEQTKPTKPAGSFAEDPLAHGQYREQVDQWNEAQRYWAAEYQKVGETKTNAQRAAEEKYVRAETEALFKVIPAMRDKAKRDAFAREAVKTVAKYGYSEQEVLAFTDHRLIWAMRDLVKYHRLQAQVPAVKDELGGKPPIIRGSKRSTPASKNDAQRRQRTDRLNETGSFQAGVAALGDLLD